jgi:shikimate kinase
MVKVSRIFLVGPMGTGKTSIGLRLSRALGYSFVDTDVEIEKRTGVKIDVIFEIEGEEGFRKREVGVIKDFTSRENIVIATGGGSVLASENQKALASGFVIYLSSSIETLMNRIREDTSRPLLNVSDREKRLRHIVNERKPIYSQVADLTVKTDDFSIKRIIKIISDELA